MPDAVHLLENGIGERKYSPKQQRVTWEKGFFRHRMRQVPQEITD